VLDLEELLRVSIASVREAEARSTQQATSFAEFKARLEQQLTIFAASSARFEQQLASSRPAMSASVSGPRRTLMVP
jgi:hypothetical protein